MVGVSPSAVSQWESGGCPPTLGNLELVVKSIGISMHEFWGRVPRARAA